MGSISLTLDSSLPTSQLWVRTGGGEEKPFQGMALGMGSSKAPGSIQVARAKKGTFAKTESSLLGTKLGALLEVLTTTPDLTAQEAERLTVWLIRGQVADKR